MSALVIKKRSDHTPRSISMHCEGGCVPANVLNGRGGKHQQNSAVRVVYIAGHPTMGLCIACSKRLRRMWDEADEGYREYEKAAA